MDLRRKFMSYIIPSIAAMLVFNIYTMVDGLFVSHFCSEYALAAINISVPFINMIFSFAILFSIGCSTLISVMRGAGQDKEANKLFSGNIYFLGIVGIVVTVLVHLFIEPISLFLGASEQTIGYVSQYITIVSWFTFFYISTNFLEVLVKADGYPKLATLGVIAGALTNIVLDYISVGLLDMGIAGAAWATGISQFVTFLIFTYHFIKGNSHLKLVKVVPKLSWFKKSLPLGVSDALTEISSGILVFAFNHEIFRVIGDSGLVSYTIISYVYNIVLMAMVGITQGMQPLVSYYVGKKDEYSINKLLKYSFVAVVLIMSVSFVLSEFGAEWIVSIFLENPAMYDYSVHAFKLFATCYLVLGISVIFIGFFVAVKQPKQALVLSLLRGVIAPVILVKVMSYFFADTGIWLTLLVSEVICMIVGVVLYKSIDLKKIIHEQ